jgi:RNA polymerase sigma factor (sigma-70 family)
VSEEALIQGCLRGSAQCQRQLYDKFASRLYATSLRYARSSSDAADILQESFVRIFTNLKQFQQQGSFEGWMRRIVIHTALRQYQRQRFDFETSGTENLPERTIDPDVMSSLSEAELIKLINQLPDGYKVVFNLVAIEGYSHAEAAEMLGIQESTSRSQLAKARRWLGEQLETLYDIVR